MTYVNIEQIQNKIGSKNSLSYLIYKSKQKWNVASLPLSLYIYICVCVCVCV